MRAITLDQPWAWAFAQAGKLGENRDWTPAPPLKSGEPVAIHAGLTDRSLKDLWDDLGECWDWPDGRDQPPYPQFWLKLMERGKILYDADDYVEAGGDPAAVRGAVVAVATFDRIVTGKLPPTSSQADWRADTKFFWLFSACDALSIPVPCQGRQKLWRLPQDVHERVIELWQRDLM